MFRIGFKNAYKVKYNKVKKGMLKKNTMGELFKMPDKNKTMAILYSKN